MNLIASQEVWQRLIAGRQQSFLYSGPVVLKECFPSELYDNFMLFHVGMFLLLSPDLSDDMIAFAHTVLVSFVTRFRQLYGSEEMVYNIHQIIHLTDEFRQIIYTIPYENYLGQIKRLQRKPHQPLQQIVKRLSEMSGTKLPEPSYISNVMMALYRYIFRHQSSTKRSPPTSSPCQLNKEIIALILQERLR